MNYTEKFHLPQWEKSDRVLMDDFNHAMADIDAGLDKNAQDAASGIRSAASCAEAAAKAQSTADSAVAKADAAQATADRAFYSGYMPYAVGRYIGNGDTLSFKLGFKPSMVIITGQGIKTISDHTVTDIALAGLQNNLSNVLRMTDTGITVVWDEKYTPYVNRSGYQYTYLAFR